MNIGKDRHGYLVLPRQSKLLFKELGCDLFGFYISLVLEASWDRRYKTFGLVTMTQSELSHKLNMDQGTISRKFRKLELLNKNLVIRHKRDIRLGYFPLFLKDVVSRIYSSNYADIHELYADMHRINANLQDIRTQKPLQSVYRSSNSLNFKDSNEEKVIK